MLKSLFFSILFVTAFILVIDGFEHQVHVRVLTDNDYEEWSYHGLPDHSLHFIKKKVTTPIDYTKMSESKCNSRLEEVKKKFGQVALMVELGHRAVLACHRCTHKIEKPMNWYKLVRQVSIEGNIVVWRPLEVKLDKYDNERLNRVFVKPNHQLIIDDFQPDDVGSYFCEAYDQKTDARLKKMVFRSGGEVGMGAAGIASAWKTISGAKVDIIVHVDVETPKKVRLVTATGVSYPKPWPEYIDVKKNIKIFTKWESWGACNNCGQDGTRRRRGTCFAKLFKNGRSSHPAHLEHTLRLFPDGAPCQSSLFTSRDMASIASRSPEVEIGVCQTKCEGKGNSSGYLDMNIFEGKKKPRVRKQKYKRVVGDHLELKCPGARDDSAVLWKNGSRVLNVTEIVKNTSGAVKIDAYNKLIFNKISFRDANKYKCYINMTKKAVFTVMVLPPPVPLKDIRPYVRYLFLSFAGDTVVFVVLLVVRHKHRLVQVKRKEESWEKRRRKRKERKKRKSSSSSQSSSSSESSSSDTSEGSDLRRKKADKGRGRSPRSHRGQGRGRARGRGQSPAGRGADPRVRDGTPISKGASPIRRGGTPIRRGGTPLGRGARPVRRGGPPTGRGEVPIDHGASPNRRGGTPVGRGARPVRRGGTPTGRGEMPVGRGASPIRRGSSQVRRGANPMSRGVNPMIRGQSPRGRGSRPSRRGGRNFKTGPTEKLRLLSSGSSSSLSSSGSRDSSDVSDS